MSRFGLLTIVVTTIFLPRPAFAYCDPAVDMSVKGEFRRSAYVVAVRAVGVTWLDDARRPTALKGPLMLGKIPGGFDPYSGANYRLDVIKSYKGNAPAHLTIFSENTEARTPLDIGQSYLLFLYRETGSDEYVRKGDLMVDYCGNSARLENAGKILKVLPSQ